jgi:hypothetical protein
MSNWLGNILTAAITIGVMALILSRCGGLYNCYDGTFIGSDRYYLTVQDKRSNVYRQMHSWNSDFVFSTLAKWKRGDDFL